MSPLFKPEDSGLLETDRKSFIVLNNDAFVKSIKMANEKGPYTKFGVWPGLK